MSVWKEFQECVFFLTDKELFFQNKKLKCTFVQYGEYLGGTTKKRNHHLFFFTAFLKCTFWYILQLINCFVSFHNVFIKKDKSIILLLLFFSFFFVKRHFVSSINTYFTCVWICHMSQTKYKGKKIQINIF